MRISDWSSDVCSSDLRGLAAAAAGAWATPRRPGPGGRRMTLASVLIVAAGLIGIGLYGALSQQSFVMLMMGLELMLNGVLLAIIGFWSFALAGAPEGQLLAIVIMRSEEHTSELQSLMRISY